MMAENWPRFIIFGEQHLIALAIILAIGIIFPWLVKRQNNPRIIETLAWILAVSLVGHEIIKFGFRVWYYDFPWQNELPLHLCRIATFVTAVVLVNRSQKLYNLIYFWGLGGGVQALLTPDIPFAFPHGTAWFFFIGHGLLVIAILYCTVVFKLLPTFKSIKQVFITTNLIALPLIPLNFLIDSNYLYLRQKPVTGSLLDFLGPWPWYLISLEVVMLVIFLIYYFPVAVIKNRRGNFR